MGRGGRRRCGQPIGSAGNRRTLQKGGAANAGYEQQGKQHDVTHGTTPGFASVIRESMPWIQLCKGIMKTSALRSCDGYFMYVHLCTCIIFYKFGGRKRGYRKRMENANFVIVLHASGKTSEFQASRRARKRNHIPDVGDAGDEHEKSFKAHAESRMRGGAKTS